MIQDSTPFRPTARAGEIVVLFFKFAWETGKEKTAVYRKRDGVGVRAGAVTDSATAAARRENGSPIEVRGLRYSPERRRDDRSPTRDGAVWHLTW
eukprot:gene16909-23183_t